MLVVVARAAAEVTLPAGMLTGAQLEALAEAPAFATGRINAGLESTNPGASGQIRANGAAPSALICTRGPAAGVWVLPGHARCPATITPTPARPIRALD